jgi:integrase/recombinase XerD
MNLSVCMQDFFGRYLHDLCGASPETIKSYRNTFSLFLPYAARHVGVPIKRFSLELMTFELIVAFLDHCEKDRKNGVSTRNLRLATFRSFAKMVRLLYPEHRELAERIRHIPQKRAAKPLIGFMHYDEILKVLGTVNLKTRDGFRDYTLLHLLFNSGARASEVASLNLDSFDGEKRLLRIIGKRQKYRVVPLWPRTIQLLERYVRQYRAEPKLQHRQALFINQRGERFTRHGIHRLCTKYLKRALEPKRLLHLNAAHSFRHSCAMHLLASGWSITDIKNFLGHEDLQSTMVYLKFDLTIRKDAQKKCVNYTESLLRNDANLGEMLDWEHREETLKWLDSL